MRRALLLALVLWAAPALPAGAARFIAVPTADTIDAGRYSLWQFGLYERKSTKTWRSLERLDLGLYDGVEAGVYVISPKRKQPDTWVNLQYRAIKETAWRPNLAVGVWDAARKGSWFAADAVGPSPFLAASKTLKRGFRYAKLDVNLGANRLNGLSGGFEARFLKWTGAMIEYAPKNLRLPGADAWDAGLYQWLGPYFRVRVSRMGGNPMVDGFFTYAFK